MRALEKLDIETNQAKTSTLLSKKIEILVYERDLGLLAKNILNADQLQEWISRVFLVQEEIYKLDFFYEGNCGLGSRSEFQLWNKLEATKLKLPSNFYEGFEEHIDQLKQYGKDEAEIRAFEVMDIESLDKVAIRKCTDVSLQRTMALLSSDKITNVHLTGKFFQYYDAVMEIIEDFYDMKEDTHDWNLNMWLTPIRQGAILEKTVFANLTACKKILRELENVWIDLPSKEKEITSPFKDNAILRFEKLHSMRFNVFKALSTMEWISYKEL